MTRLFSIESPGGSMLLDGSTGVKAQLGVKGLGMPPVSLQWFDGAGEGSAFQGGRTLPRTVDMPVKVTGPNRGALLDSFSALARILRLPYQATLKTYFDDAEYMLTVVRTGGGDYSFDVDTDGRTFLKTVITLQAGRPFFESIDSEGREIKPEGVGLGLLGPGQSLTSLILASNEGLGDVTFENSGDVEAWPEWILTAPFSGFALIRDDGQALEWVGSKASGSLTVNTLNGTVKDEAGVNQYGGLLPAPKFFSIQPGATNASVVLSAPTGASKINVAWRPRKSVMF